MVSNLGLVRGPRFETALYYFNILSHLLILKFMKETPKFKKIVES